MLCIMILKEKKEIKNFFVFILFEINLYLLLLNYQKKLIIYLIIFILKKNKE